MQQRNYCPFQVHMEGSAQLPWESASGCMCLIIHVGSKYFNSSSKQKPLRLTEDTYLAHYLQDLAKINIFTTKNPPKFIKYSVFLTSCPEKWMSQS